MAEWLCFWDAETRARNEREGVASIRIPYGKDRIAVGDSIYCMFITAKKEMMLLRRVEVASLHEDNKDAEAVIVMEGPDDEMPEQSRLREVPPEVVEAMQYEDEDGSARPMPLWAVLIDPSEFEDSESLRPLAEGMNELDSLLRWGV